MPQHAWTSLITAAAVSTAAAQPTFEILPSTLGPDRLLARGVSGDGQVIAGSTNEFFTEKPAVWRRVSGDWMMSPLPTEGDFQVGRALTLSRTGDVVAGMTNFYVSSSMVQGTPAVWTGVLSGSPILTSPLDDDAFNIHRGIFSGITADGSLRAGYARPDPLPQKPSDVWTYGPAGLTRLSSSSTTASYSTSFIVASTMSADGSVIVGSRVTPLTTLAFRWTAQTGFVELPTPATGYRFSYADAVSRDGRVIVGCTSNHPVGYDGPALPALWSEAGRTDLPLSPSLPSSPNGRTFALSANGHIAGGVQFGGFLTLSGDSFNRADALLWIDGQVHTLAAYLSAQGVDLQGLRPHWITGISDDGRVIVGFGSQSGVLHAFVVTFPAPCPVDLNGDGVVDFADYLEFLNLFDALDPRADLNADGVIDFADYLEFLNLFDAGC